MTKSHNTRRNFLTSMAILSAGTAFGSTIKRFATDNTSNDLQKEWSSFWKKSGGRIVDGGADLNSYNRQIETKGHLYKYGAVIYFLKENIIAQPTWIYWRNDRTKPADVVVSLFEKNHLFRKTTRLNRYEMDALYHLSKVSCSEQLLLASFNNSKPVAGASTGNIKTKTSIKKNSQVQDISYHKGQVLVFEDKLIHYHT
ncbi:MAG: hypothetical protein ABI707_18360 [Ferruginibacter sp.]